MCCILLGVKRIFEQIVQLFVQRGNKKRRGLSTFARLTESGGRTAGSVLVETDIALTIWLEGLLRSEWQTVCFVLASRKESIKGSSFIQEKEKKDPRTAAKEDPTPRMDST